MGVICATSHCLLFERDPSILQGLAHTGRPIEATTMTRPLSNFQLAAYSGVSLPAAAMGMPIAVYLPRFYSEGLGLS